MIYTTMEKESCEVKLIGVWASAPCTRVHLALKLKGIAYDYIEEDLSNKTDLLLRSNPVHKKVPILLHKGKPLAESLVILEYIDEYWSDHASPKLLPDDPYLCALVRFWAHFFDDKIVPVYYKVAESHGENRKKAIEEFTEVMDVMEKGLERDFNGRPPFTTDDDSQLGYLDIVVGAHSCNYKAFNEAVAVIFDPVKHPLFFKWVTALKEHPLMKGTLPPHHKLVAALKERFSQLND